MYPVAYMDYANVFSISPNPACLVNTTSVQNVMFKIRFCIRARQGLSLILGDVGMGKSSLLRALYAEMSARDDMKTTLIHTAKFKTDLALLKNICDQYSVPRRKAHIDQAAEFERFLLSEAQNGHTVVLFVDEAQLLNSECLEVFRSLLNYENNTHKLIQIVIAGQLGLGERLLQKKFKAVKSRIFAPCMLNAMTFEETRQMLDARCEQWQVPNPFDHPCVERMYARTGGIPRHTLNLAAMTAALSDASGRKVTADLIDAVADDLIIRVQESADEQADAADTEAAVV